MFESHFTKNLKEGEELILVVRRYIVSYSFHLLLALLCVLLPFFFLFPLFRLGGWGIAIFLVLLVFGISYGIRQSVLYALNALMITNQRIVDFDQRGMFDRVVSEASYEKIQDVSITVKGVWQTLLNYGDLQIQTAGNQVTLEIKDILHPQRIQDLITQVQKQQRESSGPEELSAKELLTLVQKIKTGVGEEEFKRLAGLDGNRPKKNNSSHLSKE